MTCPIVPLTLDDVASLMSVYRRTIQNWISDGSIVTPTRIGRRIYWHPDSLNDWLDKRLSSGNAPRLAHGSHHNDQVTPLKKRGRPRNLMDTVAIGTET